MPLYSAVSIKMELHIQSQELVLYTYIVGIDSFLVSIPMKTAVYTWQEYIIKNGLLFLW